MKFEIVQEEMNKTGTAKARLGISNDDLDIYINDILVAYINNKSGKLCRIFITDPGYVRELENLGISLEKYTLTGCHAYKIKICN